MWFNQASKWTLSSLVIFISLYCITLWNSVHCSEVFYYILFIFNLTRKVPLRYIIPLPGGPGRYGSRNKKEKKKVLYKMTHEDKQTAHPDETNMCNMCWTWCMLLYIHLVDACSFQTANTLIKKITLGFNWCWLVKIVAFKPVLACTCFVISTI